jgi:cell shape-determining protein MreC
MKLNDRSPRSPQRVAATTVGPRAPDTIGAPRGAVQQTVSAMDKLRADLQAVCDEIIETKCALEEIEEKNEELTLRNAELEQIIAQLKTEMLEKSHRVEELEAAYEKRQLERSKSRSAEVDALEAQLKRKRSQ